jgi:hypothetical protein
MLGCLRKKVIRDVFNDGPVDRARVWMGCLVQKALDVRYIQNNRGSIQCLLAPTPGCSPCCRSFCIPVVVAGKGLFWRPWANCSSRNLRIVSAWTSSCLSRSLIYHNLIVNCQQTIHGDIDIYTYPQIEVRVTVVAVFIGKEVGRNRAKIEECILHMRIKVVDGVFGSDRLSSEGICGELEESSGRFRLK